MTELKTLKDIGGNVTCLICNEEIAVGYVNYDEAKALAIKWVKEDIAIANTPNYRGPNILERYMKRLNITEEDL